MKSYEVEAVLVLPEGTKGVLLPQSFYQKLLNEPHEVKEAVVKKVGRGHRTEYIAIGACSCAARGKLLYVSGELTQVPQETSKYLHFVATTSEMFFLLNDTAGSLTQPNYTLKVKNG